MAVMLDTIYARQAIPIDVLTGIAKKPDENYQS